MKNKYLKFSFSELKVGYFLVKRMVDLSTLYDHEQYRLEHEFKLGQIKTAMDKRGMKYES